MMERPRVSHGIAGSIPFLMIVFAAGCGGEDTAPEPAGEAPAAAPTQPAPTGKAWDPALGTATIAGTVKFEGEPPTMREIDMSLEPICAEEHDEPALERSLLVNPDGSLRNAFVWIREGLEDWAFPVPDEPVLIDQTGCRYEPHVIGVQTRQEIKVRNSDPFQHNIHALPKRQREFNFSQPQQGMESLRSFRRPEVLVRLKCDVHGWMQAYVGVVDHPYFAVTGDGGTFELPKLPPGSYTIGLVHERLGSSSQTVTVGDGETVEIEFTLQTRNGQ